MKHYWKPTPPTTSELGDHDVPQDTQSLKDKRIALLICGGIAAMKAPLIARSLRRHGAEVIAYVSKEALRYVTADTLEWSTDRPVIQHLSARSEHLSDSRPIDIYLVAPATYNTINKMYHGIADGLLTATLASAVGKMERGQCQILIAPTMHGSMHNSILETSLEALQHKGVIVIPPRDDYGKHNLPDPTQITYQLCRHSSSSPLKDQPILVTGGPTPVAIDGIRRLTNRFSGRLGQQIAHQLYLKGANVFLLQGQSGSYPPAHIPHQICETFEEYQQQVFKHLKSTPHHSAIFSAAVADYTMTEPFKGKVSSGQTLSLELTPTPKVIAEVRQAFPTLNMVTFKYEEGLSHEALMSIAQNRLQEGYQAVVANRGEEQTSTQQVAYLVTREDRLKMTGKKIIAEHIVTFLEKI